jgi:DNA-directed RNA polymerase specialized sigma24 family protein
MERSFDRAGAITRRGCGARETMQNVLVASLRICQAQWLWTRGSARSDPGVFCFIAGTARSRRGPPGKGRLRSYLLVSLRNFLAKARRRELTLKRGEGRALVPLDELIAREHADMEPADNLTADKIYERRWALTLLEQVLTRLDADYRAAGNAKLFDCLKEFLSDEPDRRSQAEVAAELGVTENAVKQAFHRLRQRYRQLLRDEIAQTVAVPGDVEEELRHFISVLQT